MKRAVVVTPPGEGRKLEARGSTMVFKAGEASTSGAFSFMERELPPGGRKPPPHIHTNCDEAYYVLAGEVDFLTGDGTVRGGAGTFVLLPRGVPHTFGNAAPVPARLLILHAPALDGYFEELDALWAREVPPTPEEEREVMRRHGMEPAALPQYGSTNA